MTEPAPLVASGPDVTGADSLHRHLVTKSVPADLAMLWVASWKRRDDLLMEQYALDDIPGADPADNDATLQWGYFVESATYWGARGYAPDDVTALYVACSGIERVFFGWGNSGLPHDTALKFANAGINVSEADQFIGREDAAEALFALMAGVDQ